MKHKILQRHLDKIEADLRKSLAAESTSVVRTGELLIEAKAQLSHGKWELWLGDNGLSPRSAQRYMATARSVAKYDTSDAFVSPVALHALADQPRKVVEIVLERAEAGELISEEKVAELGMELELQRAGRHKKAAAAPPDHAAEAAAILEGPPPELPPAAPPRQDSNQLLFARVSTFLKSSTPPPGCGVRGGQRFGGRAGSGRGFPPADRRHHQDRKRVGGGRRTRST